MTITIKSCKPPITVHPNNFNDIFTSFKFKNRKQNMKKEIFAAYAVIGIGYWFYLIWALGATSAGKAYLFGRAIMWPFILLGKLF